MKSRGFFICGLLVLGGQIWTRACPAQVPTETPTSTAIMHTTRTPTSTCTGTPFIEIQIGNLACQSNVVFARGTQNAEVCNVTLTAHHACMDWARLVLSSTGAGGEARDIVSATLAEYQDLFVNGKFDPVPPESASVKLIASGTYREDNGFIFDGWSKLTDMPAARSFLSCAVADCQIYVIGGFTNAETLKTFHQYNPLTNTWREQPPLPWTQAGAAAVILDGQLFAVGGWGTSNRGVVQVYNLADNTWTVKPPENSLKNPRAGLACVNVNGKLYAIGGAYLAGHQWVETGMVEEYDPALDRWTEKSAMPTARAMFGCAVVNGKIYAIGGGAYEPNPKHWYALDTVEEYDPVADSWRTIPAPMPSKRGAVTAAAVDGKVYLIGGSDEHFNAVGVVDAFDPQTGNWTISASMPTKRGWLGSAVVNDRIYAIGGGDFNLYWHNLAATEIYNPVVTLPHRLQAELPRHYVLQYSFTNEPGPAVTFQPIWNFMGVRSLVPRPACACPPPCICPCSTDPVPACGPGVTAPILGQSAGCMITLATKLPGLNVTMVQPETGAVWLRQPVDGAVLVFDMTAIYDITINRLTFVQSDGLPADEEVANVKLFFENDNNGVLSARDRQFGATQAYSAQSSLFSIADPMPITINGGETQRAYLVYAFTGAPGLSTTFNASITEISAGAVNYPTYAVEVKGGLSGENITLQETASVEVAGPPEGSTWARAATDQVALSFDLTANQLYGFPLTAIAIESTGSATETEIAALRIFMDTNRDGIWSASDPQYGATMPFVVQASLLFEATKQLDAFTPTRFFLVATLTDVSGPTTTFQPMVSMIRFDLPGFPNSQLAVRTAGPVITLEGMGTTPQPRQYNLAGDLTIDRNDLLILIGDMLYDPASARSDFDSSGHVDSRDLFSLLRMWGRQSGDRP